MKLTYAAPAPPRRARRQDSTFDLGATEAATIDFSAPEGGILPHPYEVAEALMFHRAPRVTAQGAYAGLILELLAKSPTLAPAEIVLIDPELATVPDLGSLRGQARITLVLSETATRSVRARVLQLENRLHCRVIDRGPRTNLTETLMAMWRQFAPQRMVGTTS